MSQLQIRNPQAFKKVQQLMNNNGNPQEYFNSITKEYTPEQMQKFRKFANNFGYTDDKLNQLGINTK